MVPWFVICAVPSVTVFYCMLWRTQSTGVSVEFAVKTHYKINWLLTPLAVVMPTAKTTGIILKSKCINFRLAQNLEF